MRSLKITLIIALAVFMAACSTTPPTPMPGAGTGTTVTSADQITGIVWEWTGLLETSPAAQSAVPDPENYTLVFQDNGVFNIKSACNSAAGTYSLVNDSLEMVLGPSTKAFCGEDSLDTQYQLLINKVAKGTISPDGQLWLYLKANAGRMEFRNGGSAPQ